MANSVTARFNDNCKVHVAMSNDTTVTKAVIIDADGNETDIGGGGGSSDFSAVELTLIFTGTDEIELHAPIFDDVLNRTFSVKTLDTSNSVIKIIKCSGGAYFALFDVTNNKPITDSDVTMAGDVNYSSLEFKITGNGSITYNYSA